jgi:peptide/nickel transport system permease protein
MTQTAADQQVSLEEPRVGQSLWADAVLRLRRDWSAMLFLAVIVIYAVVALLAPYALRDWKQSFDYNLSNHPPSLSHPLGTDVFGRDVLQKTMLGAHLSMSVALWANIIAIPLGMLLGAVAGYYGGWIDDLIVWLYTTLTCIPGIIRIIAIKFAFDRIAETEIPGLGITLDMRGMTGLILALSITGWIGTCRLVRAETLRIRELDYVLASRAIGRHDLAILIRHVIPNVSHLGIINFSLGFYAVIMAEVTLSYLNLGVPGAPSWGRMIKDANMDLVAHRWWELTAAVGAMFFIVLAWNIFGDRLRDALDPRLKNVS